MFGPVFLDDFSYHTISIYRTIVPSVAYDILKFFLDRPDEFFICKNANVVSTRTRTRSDYYTVKYGKPVDGRMVYAHAGITWVIRIVDPAVGGYWVNRKRELIQNNRLSQLIADLEDGHTDTVLDIYVDDDDIDCCMLKATINPIVLRDGIDYLSIADETATDDMIRLFDLACSSFPARLFRPFAEYKLGRIDYCVNVDCAELLPFLVMRNKALAKIDIAEMYMILIEQADIPRSYTAYDSIARMGSYRPKRQRCYYVKNKSVHLNFYWKSVRLRGVKHVDAGSVIRLEVQCLYPKVRSLGGGGSDWVDVMLKSGLAKDVILRYWKRVVGMGDWYSLPEAKKRVMASDRRADFKKGVVEVLELVNKYHGVARAKAALTKGKSASAGELKIAWMTKYLKGLEELGINPVTIGIDRGISYMPNLLKLFCDVNRADDVDV